METIIICPKCSAEMVPVRRSGVLVDRCSECGGVYLDRGELEKLVAIEQKAVREWNDDYVDDDGDDYYEDRSRGGRKKSRKRSFFEDLFDIG